jgi:hypothetical protein
LCSEGNGEIPKYISRACFLVPNRANNGCSQIMKNKQYNSVENPHQIKRTVEKAKSEKISMVNVDTSSQLISDGYKRKHGY